MKFNKTELVEEVTNYTRLTETESREAIGSIISVITDCLVRGEKATLVGSGTFEVAWRKARTGRNPQTGEAIQIPAKRVPKFLPGKTLREKVR